MDSETCKVCEGQANYLTLNLCRIHDGLACLRCFSVVSDLCPRCLKQCGGTDLAPGHITTTTASGIEFEGDAAVPSTLNTTPPEAIPDSTLRLAKLVQGMLPDWGGNRLRGRHSCAAPRPEAGPALQKRDRVLKEEVYTKT